MTALSRVPDDLTDERDMRKFLDALDRRLVHAGNITDLSASPTNAEIATAFNALLAAMRTR